MTIRDCFLETASTPVNWDLSEIVKALRSRREASLAARQLRGRPLKLPSRKALQGVIEGLGGALFPNRLGPRELVGEGVDYFVGRTLDINLRELVDQVTRELRYSAREATSDDAIVTESHRIVRNFAERLPHVRGLLESDLQAAYEGDLAATTLDDVLVCCPGITAMIHHRIGHVLYELGVPLVARIIGEIAHSLTGIEIHPGAQVGASFFINHGTGVVVGETAVIGDRVRLYHGVTLGATRFMLEEDRGSLELPRHPIVEDDVVIYAGATILGRVTIGRGSTIGGNVWLTRSVPPGSQITQAKLCAEHFDGGSGI